MSDTQHYDEWIAAAICDPTCTALEEREVREMFAWTSQHGPANCWTGTAGSAAAMIRRLIRERAHLIESVKYYACDE